MMSDKFETAFEQFMDGNGYEKAESLLFSVIRLAFAAGWTAAGGENEQAGSEQE